MRFAFVAKHRGIWPVSWICEAPKVAWRRLAQRLSCLVGSGTKRPFAQRCRPCGQGPRELHIQLPDLWRPPRLARPSG